MRNKPRNSTPPLLWGQEHEEVAIKEYEKKTDLNGRDTGIWIFHNANLAALPDGVILDPHDAIKIIGCLQIKCRWRLRNSTFKNNSD